MNNNLLSSSNHQSNNSIPNLSQVYTDHPIVWFDPSLFNAQNQQYSSIAHASKAYTKEKKQIVSCYERQLQRLLSQFSVALKQIESLEDFRKRHNNFKQHNHHNPHNPHQQQLNDNASINSSISSSPLSSISYNMYVDDNIEKLNHKMRVMNDDMVNTKNLYRKQIDIINKQNKNKINELNLQINQLHQLNTKLTLQHNDALAKAKAQAQVQVQVQAPVQVQVPVQNPLNSPSSWNDSSLSYSFVEDLNILKYNTLLSKYNDVVDSNASLQSKLKSIRVQHKILLKKHADESYLKAKRKISSKEMISLKDEQYKLQLEELSLNKDIVINRLAEEYHDIKRKYDKANKKVDHLNKKLQKYREKDDQYKSNMLKLKDEYVSRIQYHREQTQQYIKAFVSNVNNNQQSKLRRTSQVLNDIPAAAADNDINRINHSMSYSELSIHSRTDSNLSNYSASADVIVPSLVMGIDEKLDQILTPQSALMPSNYSSLFDFDNGIDSNNNKRISHTLQHSARDTFTYLDYGITPRAIDPHHIYGYSLQVDDDDDNKYDDDLEESPPQPSPQPSQPSPSNTSTKSLSNTLKNMDNNIIPYNNHHNNNVYTHLQPRSNASLLFGATFLSEINDVIAITPKDNNNNNNNNDNKSMLDIIIDNNTKKELAEKNLEYEDTLIRYEKDISELRESIEKLLIKNKEHEALLNEFREKNKLQKTKQFDWNTKQKEYKSLLNQYSELRERNAKLTLTYFTLQCEYDKLKRDYDNLKSASMTYGDYHINLSNHFQLSGNNGYESTNSSNHNLLTLSNNNSPDDDQSDMVLPSLGLNVLSDDQSDQFDDDENTLVVSFMSNVHQVTRSTFDKPVANLSQNVSLSPPNSTSNNTPHKQQLSQFNGMNNILYNGKSKDELIDEIIRLKEKLSEMTDTKYSILQSTKKEIDRLASKVKLLEDDNTNNISEIQLDLENDYNKDNKKHRKSFGGGGAFGTIGIGGVNDHTYKVSKNSLDIVAKNLLNKSHTRTQSMATMQTSSSSSNRIKHVSPTTTTTGTTDTTNSNNKYPNDIIDEMDANDNNNNNNNKDNDDDNNDNSHNKSLTFLQNIDL